MSEDDSEITLTDGYTNPIETNIQPTRKPEPNKNHRSITETVTETKTKTKDKIDVFFERTPINQFEATLILTGFTFVSLIITFLFSIYNVLGILSILTGGIVLFSTQNSKNDVIRNSRYKRAYYTIFGFIFIGVGGWYGLMGIVFEYPL